MTLLSYWAPALVVAVVGPWLLRRVVTLAVARRRRATERHIAHASAGAAAMDERP